MLHLDLRKFYITLGSCHVTRFSDPAAHFSSGGGTTRRFFLNATGGMGRFGAGSGRSGSRAADSAAGWGGGAGDRRCAKTAGTTARGWPLERAAASRARRRLRSARDFHHDPLRGQGGLALGDLLLLSFVFGLAGGLRFPVALFALRAVLLLALSMHPHPRGLGLPALGGGGQKPRGLGPLRRGHGAGRLAVQIVAAVALAVEQGQPVAIPARVVGQILA